MNIQTEIKFDHFAIATDDLEQTVQNLEKILQYPLSLVVSIRCLVRTTVYFD